MTVKEVDGVRIEDGTGTVLEIDRRQKNAGVKLEVPGLKFPVAGWLEIGDLDVIEGDTVDYEIHKGEDGYRRYVKLARAGSEGTSAPGESQRDHDPGPPPRPAGVDDVQGGGGSSSSVDTTPERVLNTDTQRFVLNTDTQRFESYGFLAACGMVDLAYEELTDAKNAGTLDAVTPRLVHDVAVMLLDAADAAQRELVGSVNRNQMSHTRARGAVRTALRSYPYQGETVDWGAALTRAAAALLQVAASL